MTGRELLALAVALPLGLAAAHARGAEGTARAFDHLEPGPDGTETFRLNALGIVSEEVSGHFGTLVFGGRSWRATRGKFRHATSYDDFFRMVGRDDLGAQHARRRALSGTLYWGGVAAEVGGLALFLSGLAGEARTRVEIGLGVFAGGLVASTVGASIAPPVISEEEALRLAEDYNQRLRVHLGLGSVSLRGRF
jgi:hypothetical protein